jgi:hypothetical protein
VKNVREIGTVVASLIEDRGILKYRMNFIKENKIFGFLKPL